MSSDYQLEDTIFLPFTTRQFSDGVPTVLAGTPAIDIYENATATPIVTGETLVVSLNTVVGFNMLTVTATAATGFEVGGSYTAIIQAGTVGGVSVVGEVVAHFTIDASAAAQDLANGTDGLGAIKAETALIVADTNELQGDWVNGGRLDLIIDAILADTGTDGVLIATGAIASTTFAAAAIDAAAIAADAIGSSELASTAVNEIVDQMWNEVRTDHATAGTFGESFQGVVSGAAEAGTLSTTQMTTDLSEATDDHFNGSTCIWLTGVLAGQRTNITDYAGATGLLTYTAVTEAPSATDRFILI